MDWIISAMKLPVYLPVPRTISVRQNLTISSENSSGGHTKWNDMIVVSMTKWTLSDKKTITSVRVSSCEYICSPLNSNRLIHLADRIFNQWVQAMNALAGKQLSQNIWKLQKVLPFLDIWKSTKWKSMQVYMNPILEKCSGVCYVLVTSSLSFFLLKVVDLCFCFKLV